MHLKNYVFTCLACCQLFIACKNNTTNQEESKQDTTTAAQEPTATIEPPPIITYLSWPIKTNDSLKKIFDTLTPEHQKVLFALNRVDKKHIKNIDTIVVPEKFTNNLLDYSPFPTKLDILAPVYKLVIFSYPIQAYAVYEKGALVKWGPTNMGKKSTKTPEGLFFTNWKGKEIRSSVDKSWILRWNFNISNLGGVGWHQYALPGYPASHSCLRLLEEDAKWLYDWADQWILKNGQLLAKGTPTIVFGDYPWGERRPWKHLLEDAAANTISVQELNDLINPFMEKIEEAQETRAQLQSIKTDTTIANSQVIP